MFTKYYNADILSSYFIWRILDYIVDVCITFQDGSDTESIARKTAGCSY